MGKLTVIRQRPDEELMRPLAENLCASWIAWKLGVSVQWAFKQYVRDNPEPLGEFWYQAARMLVAMDERESDDPHILNEPEPGALPS